MKAKMWRIRRAIKFWWQRQTRGWDDSELWNLDHSLAKLILPRLRAYAEIVSGYPADSTPEQWQADLQSMIDAFETISSEDYWEATSRDEEALDKVLLGLKLFSHFYLSLWD